MSSTTKVHSNAFNFRSSVQHGVDPRTGLYTVTLSVPELKPNALQGPLLPLTLSFSPMSPLDVGFGVGWNLNLTEFNPDNNRLSLGTGESFKVTGGGVLPDIAEKKLDSFHFHVLGDGMYRVVHKAGTVEMLQTGGSSDLRRAVPVQVLDADGRQLDLDYATFRGGQRLESVSDSRTKLLQIERPDDQRVELQFFPHEGEDNGPLARFVLELNADGWVTRVVLPVDGASWRFTYEKINEVVCVTEVWTPTGAHETVEYDADGHSFPAAAHPPLPRVGKHIVRPLFGQPPMETRYSYSDANFLGYDALDRWSDEGEDNLYEVANPDFRYTVTATHWNAGLAQRTVERKFNRFHLLVDETTTEGNCQRWVHTTHHADLPGNIGLPFKDQPPECQLPHTVETHWKLTDDATRERVETVTTRFDAWANLLERVNEDGTREVNVYFEVEGAPGLCPADPEQFKRSLRSATVYPAASEYGDAPTLQTDYEYVALDPLPGFYNRQFLREHNRTLKVTGGQGEVLLRTDNEYYTDTADTLRLGRLKSETEKRNDLSHTTDFQYALRDATRAGETILQVVETRTGFDATHQKLTQEHSLLNAQPLLVQDLNGVQIAYTYDALQRVVSETVAPGNEYEATRWYEYHLVDGGSEVTSQAWQLMTDVKGVKTRSWFDGAARTILEERQDADAATEQGRNPLEATFRPTYEALHDGLGQLASETEIDWLGGGDLRLTSTYTYGFWGERERTTRPDGVTEVDVLDPIGSKEAPGAIRKRWLESTTGERGATTEIWLDAFGEPVREVRTEPGGTRISLAEQHRDGLGRLVEDIDARDAYTRHAYDAFDRDVLTTLPGGAEVVRAYAPHSTEDLPVSIAVSGKELGTQTFDGLDRMVETVTGGRKRTLTYDEGMSQPRKVVTPAGKELTYVYEPQLGEAMTQRVLQGSNAIFVHDPKDASLVGCISDEVELERTYYSTGALKDETRRQNGHSDVSQFTYSLRGRLRSSSVLGELQELHYDRAGRLERVVASRLERAAAGTTTATFHHDAFGRVERIVTGDSGAGTQLEVTLTYDTLGREKIRTLDDGSTTRMLERTYDAEDALKQQTLKEAGTVVRDETYHYDERGRLLMHVCAGSELPRDAYGNEFTRQVFVHDDLDNIERVITTTVSAGTVTSEHHYEETDPVQLSRITHDGARYPGEIVLAYDADGNLVQDDQGRTLHYDGLGRLTTVEGLEREAPRTYAYDGLDVLAGSASNGVQERRFYVEDRLVARAEGGQHTTYVRAAALPIAERVTQDGATSTALLAVDAKASVLGVVRPLGTQHRVYTAYGHEAEDPPDAALGYNGESHEAGTGWQLLGNGKRALDASTMRFQQPDDQSPFDQGGMNAYAYCGNDPVNWIDPSGRWFISPAVMVGLGAVALAAGIGGASLAVQDETLRVAILSAATVPLVVGAGLLGNALYRSHAAGRLGTFLKGIGRMRNAPAVKNNAAGWNNDKTPEFVENLEGNVYVTRMPDAAGRHQAGGVRRLENSSPIPNHEWKQWISGGVAMQRPKGRVLPRFPEAPRRVHTDIRTGGQRFQFPAHFQY